jgi:hypothetical protein
MFQCSPGLCSSLSDLKEIGCGSSGGSDQGYFDTLTRKNVIDQPSLHYQVPAIASPLALEPELRLDISKS